MKFSNLFDGAQELVDSAEGNYCEQIAQMANGENFPVDLLATKALDEFLALAYNREKKLPVVSLFCAPSIMEA